MYRCLFPIYLLILVSSPATAQQDSRKICDDSKASADLTIAHCTNILESIRDAKNRASAFYTRGLAYSQKGDLDRAIADYDQAIRLNPSTAWFYPTRARASLYSGNLSKALADFTQVTAMIPKSHYMALWLEIVNKRSQLQSQLGEATKQLDMTKWPAPVIRFYLGQLTPQALLAAADDPDAKKKAKQICEAFFYTGQWQLQRGDKRQATALFQKALSSCSKTTSIEHEAAREELKALNVR
jgi:lipoprotein NlpI